MDIRDRYYRALSGMIVQYLAWRYTENLAMGRDVLFYGKPLVRFLPKSSVALGERVSFVSVPSANMVGLSRKSSIAVLDDASLTIGDYSGFSAVSIVCARSIAIGRHCNFGGNVSIWDTDFHPLNWQERREFGNPAATRAISIGDDVFVGANSIILKGVEIGDRAIIGAGSVVSGSIPADEIWAGNPARFIRRL